jgi:uncharacterized peroxidase-related enzyme
MTFMKSMADDAKVYDFFSLRPATFEPFIETCEQIMRGPSPLTPAQRELIGTYVSKLNSCPYCHDVHNEAVKAYGIDGELTRKLVDEPDAADVEDNFKVLLDFVRKITEGAYRVGESDYERLYQAGWDDDAIHDASIVACLFNFMNRLVSSFGIEADAAYLALSGSRIKDEGYTASLEKTIKKAG